jgi:mannosyl-3-phosphoglycerate phosphatase
MGTPYTILTNVLGEIRRESHLPIQGFSEMTHETIAQLTGLDVESARLAAQREFDEPFIISEHQAFDIEAVQRAAQEKGLQVTTGGRFFHILGQNDKGKAVNTLISWYTQSHSNVFSIALGDSPNDFSMLNQVDQAILIPLHRDDASIVKKNPHIMISKEPGPKGWNTTIIKLIKKKIQGGIRNNV